MAGQQYVVSLLLIHIFFCLILIVLFHYKFLHIPRRNLMMAVLLPIWGGVMVFIAEVYTSRKKAGEKEQDLLEMREDDKRFIHQTNVLGKPLDNSVIPLEEALVLKNPAVRRQLVLEIVQEDPEHYIGLLKKVRLSDDPEVSHYATTAIMQIQRAFETDLKIKEQAMKNRPRDAEAVQEYLDKMNEYIRSGLLANNALIAQRKKLNTHYVTTLTEFDGSKTLYQDAIDNVIELNDSIAAESLLLEADKKWPSDEAFFLLKMKLFHQLNDRWAMRKEIQAIKESGIYLSPKTREVIEFWTSRE